jgi:hypothetical protein
MQESDRESIRRRGAAARVAGKSSFDNPFFFSSMRTETPEQIAAWFEVCSGWAAGWLREDAGRDKQLQRMLNMPCW